MDPDRLIFEGRNQGGGMFSLIKTCPLAISLERAGGNINVYPIMQKKGTAFCGSLPSYLKQQLYSKQIRRVLKSDHSFTIGYDPVKKMVMKIG